MAIRSGRGPMALDGRARRAPALDFDQAHRRHRAAGDLDGTGARERERARGGPASNLRGWRDGRSAASRKCSTSAHHERASACWDMRVRFLFLGPTGLAVGLAQKESRYAGNPRRFAP